MCKRSTVYHLRVRCALLRRSHAKVIIRWREQSRQHAAKPRFL
jgi:hypothetical protein